VWLLLPYCIAAFPSAHTSFFGGVGVNGEREEEEEKHESGILSSFHNTIQYTIFVCIIGSSG